jgi:hypothetical protein
VVYRFDRLIYRNIYVNMLNDFCGKCSIVIVVVVLVSAAAAANDNG